MTLDEIKAQIGAHPKTALAVGAGCLGLFVAILIFENKSNASQPSGKVGETVDPVTATTSGANTNGTDAQLQASLAATQEQGTVSIAESNNALTATKDTNTSNIKIANIRYGDAKDVALDQDNTSVLLGAQRVDLGKYQSNNSFRLGMEQSADALTAAENANAAKLAALKDADNTKVLLGAQQVNLGSLQSNNNLAAVVNTNASSVKINAQNNATVVNTNASRVQINSQNNATVQQNQTYTHDLNTQEVQLAILGQNQNTQLAQQREADNYHLTQDQISAGLVGQAIGGESSAFSGLKEKHRKNRFNAEQQNIQNLLSSYRAF